ncbi:radial spoke head protein 3 homolog [Engraulis encrasicolus]|uniref:radial spoke head protein 3 homolog n=1 Tax=Engraulis encrasicolus TaxID=184585 RepID=UPI002FD4C627
MASVIHSQKGSSNDRYTFSSRPRPVQNRTKYRQRLANEEDEPPNYGNIMYDRRVVRGNTYAQHVLPLNVQPDPVDLQRQQEARRGVLARKRAKEHFRPRTPQPVEGRKNIDVQTELYLEELCDRAPETSVECQTDAFLDKPATPLFIPAKTGKDVATQIQEGELFDFDIEVQPMLEVLVGKTMEQSLLEVMEEEELASLRQQQRAFQELRNAELVEVQRLEEQERRHRQEKDRRLRQQQEVLDHQREVAEKVAARAFAQQYLTDLLPSVFTSLREHGFFYDPVERDLETCFLPWLMDQMSEDLEKRAACRTLLDMLIRDVAQQRLDRFQNVIN